MIVDILILALLKKGPRHGYEIKKKAEGSLVGELALNNNSLYPALRRLEAEGAIEPDASAAPSQAGAPRRSFKITALGERRLVQLIAGFGEEEATSENEFFVRLAFFDLIGKAQRRSIVEARRGALSQKKGNLERLYAERRATFSSKWMKSLVEHRVTELDEEIEWTRGLLSTRERKERGE
jgi:DNA-binding PadR family transcriptional regulator